MIILGLDPHPTTHTAVALDSRGVVVDSLSVARRGKKKNDLVDAENVARVLLANPQLPPYRLCQQRIRLQELSRTRDKLAEQHKANQMMLEALPDTTVDALRTALRAVLTSLEAALKELEQAMAALVAQVAPALLTLRGIGVVLAGTVLAEVGDIKRFENVNHFASYCGAAPVERGSGKNTRWCVNVSGNRQLNRVLHLMALTRLRCEERPRTFVTKKEQEGKTKRAALRALKTHLARDLYRTLQANPTDGLLPAPS